MDHNPWGDCDVGAFGDYFFKQHCLCQSVRFIGGCMIHAMDTLPPCQQNIELQALGAVIVVAIVTEARSP